MSTEPPLAAIYRAETGGSAWPPEVLEDRIRSSWDAGRAAWPALRVAPEAYARALARCAGSGDAFPAADRAADLYLACACAAGDGAAITAFEARFHPELTAAVRRLRFDPDTLADAHQKLREELFVAQPGKSPGIARYSGHGALGGWVRVTALRSALQLLRVRRESPIGSAELADLVGLAADHPDLAYMKEVYRPAFKAAFQEALESLPSRDQNLLRQHLLDGLTIDQLGALHGVHRATAARWVSDARDLLVRRARVGFQRRAKVSGDECESILRMIESQLDETIRRRLAGG